jgi:hypothetical protein
MKVYLSETNALDVNSNMVIGIVKFSDDDRASQIRSAKVSISLPREEIKNLPFHEVEKMMIQTAFDYLSEILSTRAA